MFRLNRANIFRFIYGYFGRIRFSDGSYGVYYAANSSKAAIAETTYHRAQFYRATNEPDTRIYMREYVGNATYAGYHCSAVSAIT